MTRSAKAGGVAASLSNLRSTIDHDRHIGAEFRDDAPRRNGPRGVADHATVSSFNDAATTSTSESPSTSTATTLFGLFAAVVMSRL